MIFVRKSQLKVAEPMLPESAANYENLSFWSSKIHLESRGVWPHFSSLFMRVACRAFLIEKADGFIEKNSGLFLFCRYSIQN
jgi:hypothetical protein